MRSYLGDLSSVSDYRVRLEFTPPLQPGLIAQGMPFVSVLTEVEANRPTAAGEALRKEYGRIPYGSPLYWWEVHIGDIVTCVYIGQTVRLQIQKRFEKHEKVLKLLALHVNSPTERVMFRLCSRFDIYYGAQRCGIEHLPPDQVGQVITDVEARLIYDHQPSLNTQWKRKVPPPWKPFIVEELRLQEAAVGSV